MKKSCVKNIATSSLLSLALFVSSHVSAAMVNFSLNGEITSATTGNDFGLSVGDIISVVGEYDDSPVGAGETYVDFSTNYNNFEITFGNTVYTDEMDLDNLAKIYFFDGIFDGLDFVSSDSKLNSWGFAGLVDPETGHLIDDFNAHNDTIGGSWIVDSFQITPVPVPAAAWLFGSGIILLGSLSRKRRLKPA